MRAVPSAMPEIWRSGDFWGDNRPIARCTIQHAGTQLSDFGDNVYASFVFGADDPPRELPNVKSVEWTRGVDTDFASCTIVLYNTEILQPGATPTRDLDIPGYYTPNRGKSKFSVRWNQTPNEWENIIVPDNVITTFEGYGCDPTVCPERDPNLVQSGVWRIDEVEFDAAGLITVTCRDIGSILEQQIVFPPVIPMKFYPLSFGQTNVESGFIGPKVHTVTVDSGGKHDPRYPPLNGYTGPFDPPRNVQVTSGDDTIHVTWQPPAQSNSITYQKGIFDSMPTLRQGSRGVAVKVLQEALNIGSGQGLAIDGVFGSATKAAVQNVQRFFRANPDGVAGHAVWGMIDFGLLWQHLAMPGFPREAYAVVGYQLVLDGVRLPQIYDALPAPSAGAVAAAQSDINSAQATERSTWAAAQAAGAAWNADRGNATKAATCQAAFIAYGNAQRRLLGAQARHALLATPATRSRATQDQLAMAWIGDFTLSLDVPRNLVLNGNTYNVQMCCIWRQIKEQAYDLNAIQQWSTPKPLTDPEEVSDYSTAVHVAPGRPNFPDVLALNINVDENANLVPGRVAATVETHNIVAIVWYLIAYRTDPTTKKLVAHSWDKLLLTPGHNYVTWDVGGDLHDLAGDPVLNNWNFLAYGIAQADDTDWSISPQLGSGAALPPYIGRGVTVFRTDGGNGEYWQPPKNGAPPHPAGTPGKQPILKVPPAAQAGRNPLGDGPLMKPLSPQRLHLSYSDSSNTYYIGKEGHEFGHRPEDAFDGTDASYWLSIGNYRRDQGYSYEWIQGALPNVTLSSIKFRTAKAGYFCYVSVFAKGRWVQFRKADVIPYDERNPASHNGGDIPYVSTVATGTSEGPHEVIFPSPIPGATRVRVTFHGLQNFHVGAYVWRAGMRTMEAFGDPSVDGGGEPNFGVAHQPGPPQDDDSPDIVKSYEVYEPAKIVAGAGDHPGTYQDYTDIIKLICAWGGFFWPEHATRVLSDGTQLTYSFGAGPYGLENVDPVLGLAGTGRVWGDFMDTGTSGPAVYDAPQWDKKTLIEAVHVIRDVIGFLFYVDETGGVVWRLPNWWQVGNWVSDYASVDGPVRVAQMITIDEEQTLLGLRAKLSGRNVRERVFVSTVTGDKAAVAKPKVANPTGLRRVAGWTDMNFASQTECQMMADLIALNQMFTYRTDTITIPGYPAIQMDDQVRIYEQVTGEGYIHYVKGVSSSLDHESGVWTYNLATNWLGEQPLDYWAFDPGGLSAEVQAFVAALQKPAGNSIPQMGLVPTSTNAVTGQPTLDPITGVPVNTVPDVTPGGPHT